MKLGFDIDDVLYKTSVMIEHEVPNIMHSMNLRPEFDMSAYEWEDMFKLPMHVIKQILNQMSFDTLEYVDPLAVRAIKQYKQIHPDIQLAIVTKRNRTSTEIIIKYIEDYFYLNFDEIYTDAGGEISKLEVCKRNQVDILFDDHQRNVMPFIKVSNPLAVLVSTPAVKHNKRFAETYPHVLTDWSDLHTILDNLV